jgi:NDP-sugar pyrophosphorylase family protein
MSDLLQSNLLECAAMKFVILAAGLGSRLRQESGRRPKSLLDVGGVSLFDRLLDLADCVGLEPVVATRPEFVADFRRPGVDVLVEETPHIMVTLANACRRLPPEPLCWVGADMLFTDPAPFKELVATHLASDSFCSFFYCRTDRFKAKLELGGPEPAVTVTREGEFELSIPDFVVQAARVAPWLPGGWEDPRANFLQRAIERGERLYFREYSAPIFEIDTPADLEDARRYFARCA